MNNGVSHTKDISTAPYSVIIVDLTLNTSEKNMTTPYNFYVVFCIFHFHNPLSTKQFGCYYVVMFGDLNLWFSERFPKSFGCLKAYVYKKLHDVIGRVGQKH